MSSGSSGQEPGYMAFDSEALADGRRSTDLPASQKQSSEDKKKEKDAARDSKPAKESKKGSSTGEKSASLR